MEWNAFVPISMPKALNRLCLIQVGRILVPLSYQFPWEEIEIQIMEGSFFLELQVISGRVWCSVYKSLTGWLLARGHVGWMDVWRRNEGSAEEEGEEGKAGQTLKFPPPLEKLIRLVCLTLRRSRGAKLAELPFSKLLQDEDGERLLARLAMRSPTDRRVKVKSLIRHHIPLHKLRSLRFRIKTRFPTVTHRVGPPVPVSRPCHLQHVVSSVCIPSASSRASSVSDRSCARK